MDSRSSQNDRPTNPRRKTRTKMEVFREVYLPFVLVAVSVLLVVGIIVGISSFVGGSDNTDDPSSDSAAKLEKQAKSLLNEAEALAVAYDYEGALKLLEDAKSSLKELPQVQEAINLYTKAKNDLVSWSAKDVPDLSFSVLIADLDAALADKDYGKNGNDKYNQNFITVDEFSAILQQLFDNGYVLVDLEDLYTYNEENHTYTEKTILLPAGKKPILLTETHCNYYTYMESCHGFASKLVYGKDGFYNEMVSSDGTTVTGNYDIVPILESFIQKNPGFSYKGARAVLAFSGYDGIFGYRITSEKLSSEALAKEKEDAAALVKALRKAGYTLACYSYGNISYSSSDVQKIQEDIQNWANKITPILGQTDVMVFAQGGDIGTSYDNNKKFDTLYKNGFRFFLGSSNIQFSEVDEQYVRHNRLLVTGSNLSHHSAWFKNILTTDNLLDPARGKIPE